ncbi:MAG TPA: hydroxysqualene dehydroxylase HpnE [Methylotenera sp.]|nr:hydroxysqualene dehydroxylase HpnE [Methylotenera sp.]
MNMKNIHVAVIGGGCAGLSAAAALVDRGIQVTLFESSSQLGGRARTVVVENNDQMHLLDNGQHILLGAYRETLALLRKVGVDEKKAFMRIPLQINMQSKSAQSVFSLKSAHYLPAPLNTLVGLLSCKGLDFTEQIAAIKFVHRLKGSEYQLVRDTPLELFLIEQQQSTRLIKMLWEPLCLAALNTPIEIASTRTFLNVLKDSFSGDKFAANKKNSDFLLPRLDLSQVLSQPVAQYIQSKGSAIRLNKRIRSVQIENDGFNLETRDGKYSFSHVVVALSPARVDKLLEDIPKLKHAVEQTQTYSYQPIYTVYLQYPPETKLPKVMTGLTGMLGQWVFDRGQLCGQNGLIAVIISAEGKHQHLSQDELALRVAKELYQAFPQLTKPLWHKVIAEKRATFTSTPDLARPTNKTLQPKLFLAGDYTYADYPSTIEGAVRSGLNCANLIFNNLA